MSLDKKSIFYAIPTTIVVLMKATITQYAVKNDLQIHNAIQRLRVIRNAQKNVLKFRKTGFLTTFIYNPEYFTF
ncbi:MAG: hypothetical protein MUF77_13325, partial [Leptospira sp.]|nr:hypothetical protein [Leptospira sp.]